MKAAVSRRDLLRSGAALAAAAVCQRTFVGELNPSFTRREAMLDELEKRAFLYFTEQAHPETGLVRDRARVQGHDTRRVASIAATGFGLSSLCIADQRAYLKPGAARERVERTLDFLANRAYHQQGFFFHFLDAETGERAFRSEVSSVDTTWLLCGVIHARQHFANSAIERLANTIIDRVAWDWMWDTGPTLCQAWTPELGFLPYRWDCYCELLAMYLLAIGSTSHPIPASAWNNWKRPKITAQAGRPYIESPAPLFVHQYSHAWFDFRYKRDKYADYFQNSRMATLLHRDFCMKLRGKFPWINDEMWGITASDSRYGYVDWGGPRTAANSKIDGTLVPCAAGGSLVFLPDACCDVLESMLQHYGQLVWTRYGFVDAFQPQANWSSPDVIGIDLGIMMMMAENYRSQSPWNAMMSAPEVKRGFEAAEFTSYGAV